MKKFIICIQFIFFFITLFAQTEQVDQYVKTWRISEQFAKVDSFHVDTLHINYQDANPIDRFSIANSYNGNLGSPIQSKLYFNRPEVNDFIFSNSYSPYLMNVQNATFYNTKSPFSNLNYTSGGTTYRKEDNIKFLFTVNTNKKFNFGTTLDYVYARGEYDNQAVTKFSGSLFGSYNGKHYTAYGLASTNSLSNFENGGLKNVRNGINPENVATMIIPVNMEGYSRFKQKQIYYNHQYTIGIERAKRISKDSVRMDYVPVTRFAHTFKYDDMRKRYYENTIVNDTNIYKNTYFPKLIHTNDTSALRTFKNNFSISMEEEFNKWMNFGLTAFVENEMQKYTFNRDTLVNSVSKSTTKVGGILSKERGQRFRYNVLGELSLIGYKAGDFRIEGTMGGFFKLWNDSISLVANGFMRSDKPSFFLESYNSNHFRWENHFASTYRTHVGGTFSIPTRSLSINVGVENITQLIYFNSEGLPDQHSGNVQVIALNLKQDFHVGKFTLENNIVYQLSSQTDVLPLPTLSLYHNLYYNDKWFNVLSMQLGTSVRYNTAYYAPKYMPATGQFYTQSDVKIGNFPVVNVYLNFHLKRTRVFVEYYHLNQKFMKTAYFSMPNYPIDPAIIKTGVSWNFYD